MPYNNPKIKGWLRIVILIFPYIFIVALFGLVSMQISDVSFDVRTSDLSLSQRLIRTFFNLSGSTLVIYLFVKFVDREKFLDIGLHLKNRAKDIFVGVLIGFFIMGFGFLILSYLGEIDFRNINFDFKKLVYVLALYIMVSLLEEILVRGYILRNLMYSFNKYLALILSSLLFSIMHGFNPSFDFQAFIDLFLAGILLGLSYTFNKNLWLPIALHFSWNFFQSLFGFNVSGLDSYSLIEFSIPEPNIFNGGGFGFEGSVLCIIMQVIVIVVMYVVYRRNQVLNTAQTSLEESV